MDSDSPDARSTGRPKPIEPMLAKAVDSLPPGGDFLYEPKWDGFRALVFRSTANDVAIQSRDLRPLDRYFPELHDALAALLPPSCVVDGEIVITTPHGLDFGALQQRLHPAASRVAKLAVATPASFVAFDLLALDGQSLVDATQRERRAALEQLLIAAKPPLYLTPATLDRGQAEQWLQNFEGAGLDGVVAKPLDGRYQPGKRAMLKIKHVRTADCVVAGFRWHKTTLQQGGAEAVGSILLGLFDAAGVLHHVGVTSSFTMEARRSLAHELAPLRRDAWATHPWRDWASPGAAKEASAGDAAASNKESSAASDAERSGRNGRAGSAAKGAVSSGAKGAAGGGANGAADASQRIPGATSRWSADKDLSWEPLRVERVCEVKYDHLQGDRFRHATTFMRWRPDKRPADCRYDQLDVVPPYELKRVFTR